jgi:AAA domain/Transcriptional regulator, AbiEi antitoxin
MTGASDVLELVLGKLAGVRQTGAGQWMALCPAHADANPSLGVREGNVQPVLLTCYAGCATADVLAAAGLTLDDISTPREERGEWTPRGDAIAVYRYTDEAGTVLFEVCRTAGKDFPQRRPDPASRTGWRWNRDGVRPVLYRLPKVIEAVAAGEFIYVAEGEKDVHALERAGVTATCNPGGAGKWRPEYAEVLRGAIVTIVADKDEPGLRHARQVAASLDGIAAAVEIFQAAEGKDAADHLAAGLTVADFVRLPETDTSDTGEAAVSENSGPLTSDNDTSDSTDAVVQYELRDGPWLDSQQFAPLKYTVPGLMPAGLGIIAAPPKAGKSLLILDWLLAVASGGPALGTLPASPARDVLYLALEDGDRRLQARCRHLLADGEQIPERFRYILAVPPGQVLAVIADALGKHPETALIVLDTLGRIMPLPMQGETTYQRDYRVAVALKRIADDHPGMTIIVIHHTRKAFSDDFIDSISGTHGLAGAADTIITLSRGRGKGDGVLRVTGRDVIEADYAVTFHGGVWALDGDTLHDARNNVMRRVDEAALSGRSAEIIEFVRQQPDGATTKQVTDKFGKDAAQYLKRHAEAGRLSKPKRGLYVVTASEPSEVSEPQVSDPAENDTGLLPVSEVSETGGWGEGTHGAEAQQ